MNPDPATRFLVLGFAYLLLSFLIALFYFLRSKENFWITFITSTLALLIMPAALTLVGNSDLLNLISKENLTMKEDAYMGIRFISVSTLFALGGYPLIAKIYKAVTGYDLGGVEAKIEELKKESISSSNAIASLGSASLFNDLDQTTQEKLKLLMKKLSTGPEKLSLLQQEINIIKIGVQKGFLSQYLDISDDTKKVRLSIVGIRVLEQV
jgi:hypothetical protein